MQLQLELEPDECDFLLRACEFGKIHSPDPGNRLICAQICTKIYQAAGDHLGKYRSKAELRDQQF